MKKLIVDSSLCDRDGLCMNVCPIGILEWSPDGWPALASDSLPLCLACGHCVAACPREALDHPKSPLAQHTPVGELPIIEADQAYRFLRARRSIRRYKHEPVPRKRLETLLEIARFAPSGHNKQGTRFWVVEERSDMEKITAAVVEWMRERIAKGDPDAQRMRFPAVVDAFKRGEDRVLRNAPHMVVATASIKNEGGFVTTCLALEYVELYATSLGLGTCWAGFVYAFSRGSSWLRDFLNIPPDRSITGMLMVGFPEVRYHRLPPRNPLHVTWFRSKSPS